MKAGKDPIIDWDGKQVPSGLKRLPPGRYRLEPVSGDLSLDAAEEAGILKAIASIEAGRGIPLATVLDKLRRALKPT